MIYCVEDDDSIRELVIYALGSKGYEAKGFSRSEDFFSAMQSQLPELIMLDIMLPGEDGISILKKLKANPRTEDIPVILETAKGTEYDKVIGLDTGADDYLVKPFGMLEMLSRVKAVLRRTTPKDNKNVLKMRGLVLDTAKHSVTADGRSVQLTKKEYDLLKLFMENPGITFSRDKLLVSVWDSSFYGETRTVDAHIGTLRQKLENYGDCIKTVRGVGYKMDTE